jgi:hypothetical protein
MNKSIVERTKSEAFSQAGETRAQRARSSGTSIHKENWANNM